MFCLFQRAVLRCLRPNLCRSLAFAVFISASFSFACRNAAKPSVATEAEAPAASSSSAPTAPSSASPAVVLRGSPLGKAPFVSLDQLIAAPTEFAGKTVTVKGTVRRACSTKGCWMQLSGKEETAGIGCRVTFKDYGFFVPTDAAGSVATVEGEVQISVVTPSRVKHYEAEGAIFPSKNADGSANEVRLVATGVELRR